MRAPPLRPGVFASVSLGPRFRFRFITGNEIAVLGWQCKTGALSIPRRPRLPPVRFRLALRIEFFVLIVEKPFWGVKFVGPMTDADPTPCSPGVIQSFVERKGRG